MSLQDTLLSLQEQLDNIPENVVLFDESMQSNNIDDARTKLLELKLNEAEIEEKYKDNSRLLSEVRKKIALVRDFLDEAALNVEKNVRTGKNVVYQKLEKDLADAVAAYNAQLAKNEAVSAEVEQLKKRLQELSEKEIELKRLQLQVDVTQETYKNFVVKLQENRINHAMDNRKMVNVVVIEKPVTPLKPIRPRKKLNIIVGMILGATVSVAYALLSEYINGSTTGTGKE